MRKYWSMITNCEQTCLVLDLDDTLYKEYDYQTSGLLYVEKKILALYNVDITGRLLELRAQGVKDIFLELTNILNIPSVTKDSFQMMYRYHKPKINLTPKVKKFIDIADKKFKQLVILTDGRSITQRLKLESLGLLKIPAYISEEWNSEKPDKKRFIVIMDKYKICNKFCYVGDNPSKDFIAPNNLGWITVGLKGDKNNIFSQDKNRISKDCLPHYWVNSLCEINRC